MLFVFQSNSNSLLFFRVFVKVAANFMEMFWDNWALSRVNTIAKELAKWHLCASISCTILKGKLASFLIMIMMIIMKQETVSCHLDLLDHQLKNAIENKIYQLRVVHKWRHDFREEGNNKNFVTTALKTTTIQLEIPVKLQENTTQYYHQTFFCPSPALLRSLYL